MLLLESSGTPRIEGHCWKPHRDSASLRHQVSKSPHFSPTLSFFSRSVAALEIAGNSSSSPGWDPRTPKRFADYMLMILSRHTRNFEMGWSRCLAGSSSKARIVLRFEAFVSEDQNRWLHTRRKLLICARTRMASSQPKRNCRSLLTI